MRKIIDESVQLIHIGPNTALTKTAIHYALMKASSNRMYAKFYTDNVFIQVNFMKDGSISVSSNIRYRGFVDALWKMEQRGWTFNSVKYFVFQWMNVNRRLIRSKV